MLDHEHRSAGCEERTFDYLTFLKLVRSDEKSTVETISKLQNAADDPLRTEKLKYFESRLQFVRATIPLVERQVSIAGSTFGCTQPEYRLLMHQMDFPTFEGLARDEEIDRLWDKLEKRPEPTWLNIVEVFLSPFVTLVLGLLGLQQMRRKK